MAETVASEVVWSPTPVRRMNGSEPLGACMWATPARDQKAVTSKPGLAASGPSEPAG